MARDPEPRHRSVDWGKRWRNDRSLTDRVIWAIIALNVAVFVGWHMGDRDFMAAHFLTSQAHVEEGYVWTLLTYAFSHYGTGHLLFNMFGLYVFGKPIGEARGYTEVLTVFLVGAVVAAFAHLLFGLAIPEQAKSMLGASGGVMALAAYYGGMFPDRTLLVGFVLPMPAAFAVAAFLLLDVSGLLFVQQSTIAHAAHLGGAAYGLFHYQWFVQGGLGR
ncbi:MAG: rhomboid family intramembrane serine protease [Myxococcota bacterium]